jgi:hypothetical protein
LDEGITPPDAFPKGYKSDKGEAELVEVSKTHTSTGPSHVPAFLTYIGKESLTKRKPLFATAVVFAVLATVAAVGVPAGWYNRTKLSAAETQSAVSIPVPEPAMEPASLSSAESAPPENVVDTSSVQAEDAAATAARRQRERDRARAREDRVAGNQGVSSSSVNGRTTAAGSKRITVTVTYDESGRVTQASGGDASAIRIARQKRFPPGKAGSAVVTIPVN